MSTETYTLQGGCHCGAVRYIARNVNVSKPAKCSCTMCAKVGGIIVRIMGEDNLSVILEDGSEKVLNYKNSQTAGPKNLGVYTFGVTKAGTGGEGHQVYHHHCKICGVQAFILGRLDFMGGAFTVLNLNTVDNWDEVGLDLKDISEISNITYMDGMHNWDLQKGEPWPKQAW